MSSPFPLLLIVTWWFIRIGWSSPVTAWDQSFDFVVIGGGTAGLTVANRLSEDAQVSVLVVEYGAQDNEPSLLVPGNFLFMPHQNFINITSVSQKQLDDKPFNVVVGGTLGGGSAVNRLYFGKGSKADYDAWQELGNKGWGWEGLLPYFKKSTKFTPPSDIASRRWNFTWDSEAWGQDGPVQCSIPPFEWPTFPAFRTAFKEVETATGATPIPFPREGHNGLGVGVLWVPNSQDPETQSRSSALTAYFNPIRGRKNFQLLTKTKATRILFEGRRAVGIEVVDRQTGGTLHIRAEKEVILAAGPIFSPNILHKSGVGPKEMLERSNIPVVYDLPGVGTNFQDTPTASLGFHLTKEAELESDWRELERKGAAYKAAADEYQTNKTGSLILAQANSAAFLSLQHVTSSAAKLIGNLTSVDPLQHLPPAYDSTARAGYLKQRQIMLKLMGGTDSATFEIPVSGRADPLLSLLLKPMSRGAITLNHNDPDLGPLVDYNTFADPGDQQLITTIVQFARTLMRTSTIMQELSPAEIGDGASATDEESIFRSLVKGGNLTPSCSHQSGTCPMMPLELGGVVNDQLLVYGVQGLSVVDSSIFPLLPAARLASTTYAVAEKAADLIKSRHGGA